MGTCLLQNDASCVLERCLCMLPTIPLRELGWCSVTSLVQTLYKTVQNCVEFQQGNVNLLLSPMLVRYCLTVRKSAKICMQCLYFLSWPRYTSFRFFFSHLVCSFYFIVFFNCLCLQLLLVCHFYQHNSRQCEILQYLLHFQKRQTKE